MGLGMTRWLPISRRSVLLLEMRRSRATRDRLHRPWHSSCCRYSASGVPVTETPRSARRAYDRIQELSRWDLSPVLPAAMVSCRHGDDARVLRHDPTGRAASAASTTSSLSIALMLVVFAFLTWADAGKPSFGHARRDGGTLGADPSVPSPESASERVAVVNIAIEGMLMGGVSVAS